MSNELKPCPFCGSEAGTNWAGKVGCSNEKCGQYPWCMTVPEWNERRYLEPSLEKAKKALENAKYAIKGREHTGFIDKAIEEINNVLNPKKIAP